MVKIKTITHTPTSSTIHTPLTQHPFSRARQFQRALISSKLQRIFAKPFLYNFQGHSDGISALGKSLHVLNKFISGSHDGQVKIWDLSQRKCLLSLYDHTQSIKGVTFSPNSHKFLSSSSDKTINLYNFDQLFSQPQYQHPHNPNKSNLQSLTKYMSKLIIGNIDHSPSQNQFITSGSIVQVWSYQRTKPIYQLQWNIDTIFHAKYNPAQPNIIGSTGIDRSIILYDLRGESPIQKIYLNNKCPCLAFNPLQPINFTVGSQDSNCYSFDMRKMNTATLIHKDHIGAVIDIDYSPSGRQFVTGSFDKTLRIFPYNQGRSRQVYHTKRMQIINSVIFTSDAHYILSGSQDMNIRLWKAQASIPIGHISQRHQHCLQYHKKLLQKFGQSKKIKRITMHRHLPKYILNAKKRKQDQIVSKYNKKINKQANMGIKQLNIPEKVKAVEKVEIQEKYHHIKKFSKQKDENNQEDYNEMGEHQ